MDIFDGSLLNYVIPILMIILFSLPDALRKKRRYPKRQTPPAEKGSRLRRLRTNRSRSRRRRAAFPYDRERSRRRQKNQPPPFLPLRHSWRPTLRRCRLSPNRPRRSGWLRRKRNRGAAYRPRHGIFTPASYGKSCCSRHWLAAATSAKALHRT